MRCILNRSPKLYTSSCNTILRTKTTKCAIYVQYTITCFFYEFCKTSQQEQQEQEQQQQQQQEQLLNL